MLVFFCQNHQLLPSFNTLRITAFYSFGPVVEIPTHRNESIMMDEAQLKASMVTSPRLGNQMVSKAGTARFGESWLANMSFPRWRFQKIFYYFIFNPSWGNDPIWRAYFSIGLKPRTSFGITCWLMSILNDFDECFPLWLWPPLHLGKDLGGLLHLSYSIIVPEAKKDPYIILWYIMIILWSNQVILLI